MDSITKPLPSDVELEKRIIATLLTDKTHINRVAKIVPVAAFFDEKLRKVYSEIINGVTDILFISRNTKIPLTELAELWTQEAFFSHRDIIGAAVYLREIYIRRLTFITLTQISEKSTEGEDVFEIASGIKKAYDDIVKYIQPENIRPLKEQVLDTIESLLANKEKILIGLPVDEVTGGFEEGDLVTIAGRPSMGKTAIAVNILVNTLAKYKPLFISLEMSEEKLVRRMLSTVTGLEASELTSNIELVKQKADALMLDTVNIIDNTGMTIKQIETLARQHATLGSKILIVDYLQLIRIGTRSTREQAVSELTRRLKTIARENSMVVIMLAQLNRDVEKRENKVPKLSDLRESGAIEQDSDVVIFLHRPGYYNHDIDPSILDFIIAKNRDGKVGRAEANIDLSTGQIMIPKQHELKDYYNVLED